MTALRFTIPGRAVGKGRPRVTRNGTRTPERTKQWERLVALVATPELMRARKSWRMDADYALSVQVHIANTKEGKRRVGDCPDLDNVIKAVADALNGLAYEDDRQVLAILDCWMHHGAEEERTEVVLTRLGEE